MPQTKLIDAFIFHNELDLLEIRLAELAGVVDRFVLVEAKRTFTGKPKPLHFADNRSRFVAWRDKIQHVVMDFPDELPLDAATAWTREHLQREAIAQGLTDAASDDIVIISDVDEIPNAQCAESVFKSPARNNTLFCLQAKVFNYTLDLHNPRIRWNLGPRIMPVGAISTLKKMRSYRIPYSKKLARLGLDAAVHRLATLGAFSRSLSVRLIEDAAWHFTYVGTQEDYAQKLRSFAHQELNSDETTSRAYYEQRRSARRAANPGLDEPLVLVEPDKLPAYVRQNVEKFAHLLSEETLEKLRAAQRSIKGQAPSGQDDRQGAVRAASDISGRPR